jgi:two-component sensor histidine kinase
VFRTITGDERRVAVSWEALSSESANKTRASYTRAILAIVDVTERVRTQEAISANLREKEVLIRELFHRTKNNMQSILSLISFQSWKLQDENLREAMRALETRVYSMSLVHRMLYEYNDLSRLSLSAFIREFSAYLSASEDIEARGIRFDLRLEEIEVTIDVAVPLGLVIAELVDNSLIHGFPNKRAGVITIELAKIDDDHIALIISDDGVGPRPGFEAEVDGAMGLQLVESLAESQLGGKASFDAPSEGGFRCRITARPDIYSIRV